MIRGAGLTLALLSLVLSSCATVPPKPPAGAASPPEVATDTTAIPVPPVSTPISEPPQALRKLPPITVGLQWDLDSLTLDPIGEARLEGIGPRTIGVAERVSVRVRSGGGAVVTVRGGAATWQESMWPRDTLWLAATTDASEGAEALIRWNQKTWRGQLKVFLNPRGKLTVASRLPIEDYLLGVLPGEIGPLGDDRIEAGRAQAVAARSFTLFYTGRRGVEGFDLFSTVEDQVYGPTEIESPLASQCVRSTAGEVALYAGTPIRANYSSTCGGITADVWEAWPTPPMPYLVSHLDRGPNGDYCASSPHHRWHEEFTAAEFLSNVKRFAPTFGIRLPGAGMGRLVDVTVESRSRSGRAWVLVVKTTNGEIRIPAHSLRPMLRRPGRPEAILRSTLIKVGVRRDPATRRAREVIINGAGSGHGVGLCQTGALGMAREGRKGEEIIRHYFPGVEIRRFQ